MAPKLIALTKVGELRNKDSSLYQTIQEVQDKTNEYILDQSKLVGLLRSNGDGVTATEISGDGTTSASNALTVTKLNGTSLAVLGTGILKNTTGTGVPSIAIAADFPTLNQDTTGKAAKADALNSATTVVNVSTAAAPTAGQSLIATDPTHATWQAVAVAAKADALSTTGAAVNVAAAAPPTVGQTLIATDATHATWQAAAASGGLLFAQTGTPATTTPNALSTILGAGFGTKTLPANIFTVGRAIRVKAGGYVSAVTTAGAPTLAVFVAGGVICQQSGASAFTNALNVGWQAEVTILCQVAGYYGTVIATGSFLTMVGGTSSPAGVIVGASTGATVNTTGTLAIDVQVNNGAASGTYTTAWATIEAL